MPLVQTFPPRRRHALPSGGEAHLTLPRAPGPVVVLLQEIFGVNDHIKEVGDRLARAGFVVATPALFHRTAPGLRLGYGPTDVAVGRAHKGLTTRDQLLADVSEAAALGLAHPLAAGGRWASLGFCFGGLVSLLAASALEPALAVTCYGAGASGPLPDGSPSVLQGAAPRAKVLAVFGGADPSIPEADRSALTGAWPRAEILVEPAAGHGFLCDAREAFAPEAAARTWPVIIDALRAALAG
ncbi:MAG: dienelactone hydrolase family protein [Deltaproteobacteria bacterium]|nr:dienelactone hydrolase family protein [Deltaproteobacteria bacterium]